MVLYKTFVLVWPHAAGVCVCVCVCVQAFRALVAFSVLTGVHWYVHVCIQGLLAKIFFHETFCGSSDPQHFTANSPSLKSNQSVQLKKKIKRNKKGNYFFFLPAKSY